jgi:hypothetical protein
MDKIKKLFIIHWIMNEIKFDCLKVCRGRYSHRRRQANVMLRLAVVSYSAVVFLVLRQGGRP